MYSHTKKQNIMPRPSIENLLDLLMTTSSLLEMAIQQSELPIYILSPEGHITDLNKSAADLFTLPTNKIVGESFSNFVRDGSQAQQYLADLSSHAQRLSWQSEFICAPGEFARYRITGIALVRVLGAGPEHLILWCESTETALSPEKESSTRSDRIIPSDRRVLGRDIELVRQKLGLTVLQMCQIVGVSSITWYAWRGKPKQPIKTRTAELHLRLLDALPDVAKIPVHPADLKHLLEMHLKRDVTYTEVALLLGVERGAGYSWARGRSVHEQALALTASLMRLLLEMPPEAWSLYHTLIEQQATLEGTDIWRTRTWSKKSG